MVSAHPNHQIPQRSGSIQQGRCSLDDTILSLLDWDSLYFVLERFKREKTWHNLKISKEGARSLLHDGSWYRLFSTGSAPDS
jgi:hypothetical protein